jgi:hypothetical protein
LVKGVASHRIALHMNLSWKTTLHRNKAESRKLNCLYLK